jgi:acyl-CoA synthetase (AMP-forming)/AMP-acid ligase II
MAERSLPRCTLEQYERDYQGRHLLHEVIGEWAARKPFVPAIVNASRGRTLDWAALEGQSTALAVELLRQGFRKGDFLAASLPLLNEHILLEYACFKIGVIHAPLDLRLPPAEVIRCLGLIRAKGFAFLGTTAAADFRELGRAVSKNCPFVERLIQFSPAEETIDGAIPFAQLAGAGGPPDAEALAAFRKASAQVGENDGAQAIFTTGSTGAPKPALLSHRGITCQNLCLGAAFGFDENTRLLVNLPPSHVAGQAEALMTTFFWGGTAVTLEVFDAARSLEAIQRHRVNYLGQIPAMLNVEWRLAGYSSYDLSSLEIVIYGGQQVSRAFLERLAGMAPGIGTGLGLTEACGFCTYTRPGASVEEITASIGYDMPLYPMSIRQPMRQDGRAGQELPDGQIGDVCFRGPQTFLGYVNDPAATAKTISRDGFLYTGDMGYKDSRGLHFAGRSKWVLKPAGNQVFPGDIEAHLCALADRVAMCGAVGAEHKLWSEAIIAFVEKKPGAKLSVTDLKRHARGLASYMRPLHYVVLEPGQMPLNRAAKVDYFRLHEMAQEETERLRARGRWDGGVKG